MFNELLELLSGKKIALVGPAPTLQGYGLGEHIDQYDLVCRMNTDFAIPEPFYQDYGQRCDILFHSCASVPPDSDNWKRMYSDLKRHVPTYLVTTRDVPFRKEVSQVFEDHGSKCLILPDEVLYPLIRDLGTDDMNMGITVFYYLIRMATQKVFLGGISFYQNQGNMYRDGHCEVNATEHTPQDKQIELFLKLYEQYKDKIVLDIFLEKMINEYLFLS